MRVITRTKVNIHSCDSQYFLVLIYQPYDGYILAEACNCFCIMDTVLCVDRIYCTSGYTESTVGTNCLRPSPHERFFAAAVKQPQRLLQ